MEAIVGPSRNPYHFIVGCQRSGTTLLGRMVDANPHVAIIHETRWIASWFEDRGGLTPEGYVTRELIPLLLDHPRFAKLQIDREDLEGLLVTGDPVLYRDFITGIFDLYGNKHGEDLVATKLQAMCALSSPCTNSGPTPSSSTSSATVGTYGCRPPTGEVVVSCAGALYRCTRIR